MPTNKIKSNMFTRWLHPLPNLATETSTIPTCHQMMRTIWRPQVQAIILKSGTSISPWMRLCQMKSGFGWWGVCQMLSFHHQSSHTFLVVWESLPYVAITCLQLPVNHGFVCLKQMSFFFSWHHNMQAAQPPQCWYCWGLTVPEITSSRSDGMECHHNCQWRAGAQ